MKKIFLQFNNFIEAYWVLNKGLSCHKELIYLWESFHEANEEICVQKENDGWITIWSYWDIKDQVKKQFVSNIQEDAYDNAYAQYWLKRYAEIPKLEITQKNYDDVVLRWKKITEKKETEFVVITQDDFGVVSFELKDILSSTDQNYIQQDLENYENFTKKLEDYREFGKRPWSRTWSSAEDNEFYSDFLTTDEMLWKSRKF